MHGGIQQHTFASSTLPRQTPFCRTAPLLSSVTRQQNVMEYWQEVSTSASEVVVQHNKTGGITFGAALIVSALLLIEYTVPSANIT